MVKKFNELKGKASRSGPERFKYVDGVNQFRIVSPVVPGYKYWLKTTDGTPIPFDCLTFDRDKEQFNNKMPDPVRKYFPDKKCSWAYSSFVIDRSDNKLKLIDHKKKLFEQILTLASKIGDPTDFEDGWEIVVERVKTGPKAFNVEYHLDQIACKESKGPLSDEDKELLKEMPDIEEFLKVSTPEDQEKLILEKVLGSESSDEDLDDEVRKELSGADDLS